VFKVAKDATKPQIKAAVEKLFDVKVKASTRSSARARPSVFRGIRPAVGRQEGNRDSRRWSEDRRDHRSLRIKTMALKTFNPVTPSLRQLVIVDRSELYKGKPVKALTEGKLLGRPQQHGRITVRFRGGGHKRRYRLVDFKRRKFDIPARSSGSNTIRTAPRSSR
jgi:hypothetical protein